MAENKKDRAAEMAKYEREHHGEVLHQFLAPEFLQYHRGPVWYIVAAACTLGVVAYGLLAGAMTLTIAFLLFIAVYWLLHHKQAQLIETAITRHGIRYGDEFFPYGEIKNFWIIFKPGFVADLKLSIRRRLHPVITIHIFGQDPSHLQELLERFVDEKPDQGEEFVDLLIRLLRL